jgi:hypothetical protein
MTVSLTLRDAEAEVSNLIETTGCNVNRYMLRYCRPLCLPSFPAVLKPSNRTPVLLFYTQATYETE